MNEPDDTEDESFVLPNPARSLIVVFWVLFLALGVFVAIESSSWVTKVLGVAWASLAVFGCVQTWRSAIRCDGSGITAIEDLHTRRVSWADVDRFEERGFRGIGVRLLNGRWVRLMNYSSLGSKSPEMATRELERQRILHQAVPGRGPAG